MIKKKKQYIVAVVGATGAVGNEMITTLQQRNFPVDEIRLFASERSEGKKLEFRNEEIKVERLTEGCFKGIDIALFSAGAERSRHFAPFAVKDGCVVVDNSSAWRMDTHIPLVVPEVNPHTLKNHPGIIANPNCSTIQMVVALKPIHDAVRIRRIVVTTFQAVSGTGKEAMDELFEQTRDILAFKPARYKVYPHQIAFNCLPHIDVFLDDGYTKEEVKMVKETQKILGDDTIRVTATTVRVPVFRGHSESVNVETERKISADETRDLLSSAPGVIVLDDPAKNIYPLPFNCAGRDEVFVGRIRRDDTVPNGLNLWIVSDNLRKGAALNAVQIAEKLVEYA
jgi:aspartate-semialdehyde dehydrogenase